MLLPVLSTSRSASCTPHDIVEIVDTEVDGYTFDNFWRDGTPKVRHRNLRANPHSKNKPHPAAAQVIAHQRAVDWARGVIPTTLPPSRRLAHTSRIGQFLEDDDSNAVYVDRDEFPYTDNPN